jgi:hypothetical protein
MACGFRLAGSRYDERRSRANARLALTGGAKQKSSGLQVQLRITIREERDDGQHIGRIQDSDSGVPAGDEGNVRGRHVSVKALLGPKKDHGESASSAPKKAPVLEVRRIVIG